MRSCEILHYTINVTRKYAHDAEYTVQLGDIVKWYNRCFASNSSEFDSPCLHWWVGVLGACLANRTDSKDCNLTFNSIGVRLPTTKIVSVADR